MRIISGKYGGRKLVAFKANNIRPTTDRVKEVIFNKLQGDLAGARVLDLYSGTGNLAFEALSRGAEVVHAVESNGKSLKVIEQNRKALGVGHELKVIGQDVFRYLKSDSDPFDIIFVDPPFTQKIADESMEALGRSQMIGQDTQVFIESLAQETIKDQYGSLTLEKRKSYGDKFLSHFVFQS